MNEKLKKKDKSWPAGKETETESKQFQIILNWEF